MNTAGLPRNPGPGAAATLVSIPPAPAGEKLFGDFQLAVNNAPVPVFQCRVSAVPLNQVWPGYQRPLDQTEPAGFAYWDMSGPVRIDIRSQRPVESVAIRPHSLGISPAVQGNRISFQLQRPRPVVVLVNGSHGALHLFPNPPETAPPHPGTPGVHYFGPGVHHPGIVTLADNESVYLAPGAVVYGSIHAKPGSAHLRIFGRGILDQAPFPRGKAGGAVRLNDCRDVRIEGVIMRDPDVWCCSLFGCRDVTIRNVKLIGLWRYNADGIDVCNSSNVRVQDCFVRSFDDSIVLKGLKWRGGYDARPVRNITVTGCTLWCDWGRALEIGAETCAPEFADIRFRDCDVVHTTHIALDIQHGDRARIHDVRYENIRVEMDGQELPPQFQKKKGEHYTEAARRKHYLPKLAVIVIRGNFYSKDRERGIVRNVLYRNISVRAPAMPASSLDGWDAEHTVEGVCFEHVLLNGRIVPDSAAGRLHIGRYVRDVVWRTGPESE